MLLTFLIAIRNRILLTRIVHVLDKYSKIY